MSSKRISVKNASGSVECYQSSTEFPSLWFVHKQKEGVSVECFGLFMMDDFGDLFRLDFLKHTIFN